MAKKDNTVKSFILRVDADMMEAIEAWAADEFRSTNGQIQYILDQALRKAGRLKKKRLPRPQNDDKTRCTPSSLSCLTCLFLLSCVGGTFTLRRRPSLH